jgi:ABC-2 type transport system permease protein
MNTVFRYQLRRLRGQTLGWGIAMMLFAMLISSFYETVVQQREQMEALLKNYPAEMLAFFGNVSEIATPDGYLTLEFFSFVPIVLGVFAVLVGSGLLVADEEAGVLDLILAHPVSRTALFVGRLLAFVIATIGILVLTWLGFILAMQWSALGVSWDAMALPFVSLFAVLLLFGTLELLMSLLLPSRRLAATVVGFLVVASYLVTSLANIDDSLEFLARFSPLSYFQSGDAINGLDIGWVIGLLAVSAVFAGIAWWSFQRRDIRVGGEHGWRLRVLQRRAA